MCEAAGIPVPPTCLLVVDSQGNQKVMFTDMTPSEGEVWTINDLKERQFPRHTTDDQTIQDQVNDIAAIATQKGIKLNAYAYLAYVDVDGKVGMCVGDFGDTEVKEFGGDAAVLEIENQESVERFLMDAEIIEDTRPTPPPITITL